jgi:hypothetical protein
VSEATAVYQEVCVPAADLTGHVAHALSLGLPDIDLHESGPIALVASGPSARVPDDMPAVAVNGALALFTSPPRYWIACDPQPIVCNFLREAPAETTYIVASKCHPAVFDMLKGRDVRLWHIDEPDTAELLAEYPRIPVAVSVTLCAIELMHRQGFGPIHTFGWDGCYLDGRDHAVAQEHYRHGDQPIMVGDELFHSTRTWAAEGNDARVQFSQTDYEVEVHGPGFFGALLRYLDILPRTAQRSDAR